MNLAAIKADLYDRLGYNTTPDAAVTRRLLRFVNETHSEILGKKWCTKFRRALVTFSSIAGSPFCVLPQAAARILVIADRTNHYPLDELSLQELRLMDPALSATSGQPDFYVILNNAAAVARDPADASQLFLKSTDAGDVQTAYIEGVTTGGYPRTASVTLTGTTAVALAATIADWIAVTKFYLASNAVGSVTLLEDSGVGTELARISPGRSYARYTRLHLYPTPTSSLTYYADIDRLVLDLANDGDEPIIPVDFHWLIVAGTLKKEFVKREKEREYQLERDRFKEGLSDLQLFVSQQTGVAHREPMRRNPLRAFNLPVTG